MTTRKLNCHLQKNEDEEQPEEDEDDENQTSYGQVGNKTNFYDLNRNEDSNHEFHYGETWFHGPISRINAERILYKQSNLGDGTFLVRESESQPSNYTLSFLQGNEIKKQKVHHSRIIMNDLGNGKRTYQLNNLSAFSSLFELIDYYRTHPLRSNRFREMYLKTPALPANTHEDKPWFYKNLSRKNAEDILQRLRHDGAFLVRPSEREENQFSISFRAENKIKHCRIKREGSLYLIGNEEFNSLTQLIEYYEKNPLYKYVPTSDKLLSFTFNVILLYLGKFL